MLIQPHTPLAEVAVSEPSILPVLTRLGINPGLGEATARSAAERVGLDVQLLLAVLNTYISDDYFPEQTLRLARVAELVDYLRLTDLWYTRYQMPNIERHFAALMRSQKDPAHSNLALMRSLYDQAAAALTARIDDDLQRRFPAILAAGPDCMPCAGETEAAELTADLRTMLITHLKADCDPNLCYGVVVAVDALANDLAKNDRLRERVLTPVCIQLAAR